MFIQSTLNGVLHNRFYPDKVRGQVPDEKNVKTVLAAISGFCQEGHPVSSTWQKKKICFSSDSQGLNGFSATLWGLINANASGVTGSASSFTERSEGLWFYFRHTVSHPAAHFGTWIKFSCVILTLSLLNSPNVCCSSVTSSRCPHQQLALQKENCIHFFFFFNFKSVHLKIIMFWLTNPIGVFVKVGWEGGIVLKLL